MDSGFLLTCRASNEVPSKMSLTADELKPRAQPLTNTDLEDKQGGSFDSSVNGSIIELWIHCQKTSHFNDKHHYLLFFH